MPSRSVGCGRNDLPATFSVNHDKRQKEKAQKGVALQGGGTRRYEYTKKENQPRTIPPFPFFKPGEELGSLIWRSENLKILGTSLRFYRLVVSNSLTEIRDSRKEKSVGLTEPRSRCTPTSD